MMRNLVLKAIQFWLVAAAVAFTTVAASASSDGVLGSWERDDGNARVRIAPCSNALCAINTWIRDESGGEHIGDRLIMKVSGDGSSMTGTAYDPQRKLNYSLEINVQSQSMQTRGCVLAGILCKSVNWTRIPR
jgi:uncharacterized protein (DUF2147 family)